MIPVDCYTRANLPTHIAMKLRPDDIGFDFDGVIADIGEAFIRLACDDHGYCSIELGDISSFQVEDSINIPRPIVERIFEDILEDSLGTKLKPLPGALETLGRLTRIGEVTIITARPEISPVIDWFDYYCTPPIREKIRLIATGDHDNKEDYIKECGFSHFIDDRAKTCVQLAAAGLNPIVYSQPWNHNLHHLPSVANWQEISQLFDWGS